MAFKMKPGSPMKRNFPSAFPKNPSKLGDFIKDTAKSITSRRGVRKVIQAVKNKLGKNKTTLYRNEPKTELQKMKDGEYIPQSKRK